MFYSGVGMFLCLVWFVSVYNGNNKGWRSLKGQMKGAKKNEGKDKKDTRSLLNLKPQTVPQTTVRLALVKLILVCGTPSPRRPRQRQELN